MDELGTGPGITPSVNRPTPIPLPIFLASFSVRLLLGQGKLRRLSLDALRKAKRPLGTQEIVDAIAAEVNFGPDAANGLKGRVRSSLLYLSKVRGSVVKDGDRETATWRLA
jgi:hypothetical protein